MKKIFWRVFVAFGAVLLFFTILIGLMFTRFNRTNIVGAYKQQLGDLADGVVTRTSQAVKDSEADEFMDYLRAMEDFGKMQNVDIWIVADESSKHKLSDIYQCADGWTGYSEGNREYYQNGISGEKEKLQRLR